MPPIPCHSLENHVAMDVLLSYMSHHQCHNSIMRLSSSHDSSTLHWRLMSPPLLHQRDGRLPGRSSTNDNRRGHLSRGMHTKPTDVPGGGQIQVQARRIRNQGARLILVLVFRMSKNNKHVFLSRRVHIKMFSHANHHSPLPGPNNTL